MATTSSQESSNRVRVRRTAPSCAQRSRSPLATRRVAAAPQRGHALGDAAARRVVKANDVADLLQGVSVNPQRLVDPLVSRLLVRGLREELREGRPHRETLSAWQLSESPCPERGGFSSPTNAALPSRLPTRHDRIGDSGNVKAQDSATPRRRALPPCYTGSLDGSSAAISKHAALLGIESHGDDKR